MASEAAITGFRRWLQASCRVETTIRTYVCYLNYLEHDGDSPLTLEACRAARVRVYDARINRWNFLIALRAYCRYLKAHNISAPTEEQLALPKRVYSPQIPPSVDAVNRAIDAEKSVKIRAILELLYGSALRSKEVRTLRIEQIDLLGRTAKIDAGRGMRIVVLTKPAVEWLTLQIGSREIGLVFPPNRPAEIMATGTLCRMVREAGQRVGVKLHPHLLRHACAVHMLEQGAPLNCIQELLGHARLTTTTLYLAMDIAHLIRVHSACHPHGDGGTRPAMRDW